MIKKMIKLLLSCMILVTFLALPVSAVATEDTGDQLIQTISKTSAYPGYSLIEMNNIWQNYYDQQVSNGYLSSYDYDINHRSFTIKTQFGNIQEQCSISYTEPFLLKNENNEIIIPFKLNWSSTAENTSPLGTIMFQIKAGDNLNNLVPLESTVYTIDGLTEKSDTFKYVLDTDYKYVVIAIYGGNSYTGGLGYEYHYQLPGVNQAVVKTNSTIFVNDKAVSFEAYNINGYNYFKLRDIAAAINQTPKNFEVNWNASLNLISLKSNKIYNPIGNELTSSSLKTLPKAVLSNASLLVDDSPQTLLAYNINGYNFFKLRDIGKIFDFGIGWNAKENSVLIDTNKTYEE